MELDKNTVINFRTQEEWNHFLEANPKFTPRFTKSDWGKYNYSYCFSMSGLGWQSDVAYYNENAYTIITYDEYLSTLKPEFLYY